ncbi:MAG TPA: DNA-3-methyladenine glycosylase [Longimicrobiaceae bacterium]|nr:DNA-3-methyladenine glycosylase [Longimicrobiaceae bacterium]
MSPRRPGSTTPPEEAVEHLRGSDPVLREVIDRVGPLELALEPDLWWSLVDAIVAQQLSAKAAATILGRVEALAPEGRRPTPEEILATSDEQLRACGLSRAKTLAVKDLAARWLDGSLRPAEIPTLSDEEVVGVLTRVRGIGRWTAEMILIFTLNRPDVFPVDDLGIRNAAQRWYGLPERPGREELLRIGEPWRPFRTLASRYLWRSLSATSIVPPSG